MRASAEPLHIEIENTPVFVKKIPLTDRELQPENYMSTANLFNLPMCYQYGIGSAGFGAWREVASHVMTTNWVMTGKCSNFSIMYHWRMLKSADATMFLKEEQLDLERATVYWENNEKIHRRLKERILATHHIYVFLEFIPHHLYSWLNQQLAIGQDGAVKAVQFVEHHMHKTNAFMNSQNFLHMDAHFKNILTNGHQLYYSDFGLALADHFTLSDTKTRFMKNHALYDCAIGFFNLIQAISSYYLGEDSEDALFTKMTDPCFNQNIPNGIEPLFSKYRNVALKMYAFYTALQKDKAHPFPPNDIKELLPIAGALS